MSAPPSAFPVTPSPSGLSATSFAVRLAMFYAALFVVYGAQVPFLPVWLDWKGLNAHQVAAVTAAPFLLRLIVTPACALVADNANAHRRMILGLAWTALAAILVLGQMDGFTAVLAVSLIFSLASASIMPLTETIAVAGATEMKLDYGRMRLWGSLSFVAVGLAGGLLIDQAGPAAAVWLLMLGSAATVAAAHTLPRPAERPARADVGSGGKAPMVSADVKRLARAPVFLAFLVAVSTAQASHALFYTFGALHLGQQGLSGAWIGGLWAIAVLAEVLLFAIAGSGLSRAGPRLLLAAGGLAAVLRWSVMSVDPPLGVLIGLQVLHALTFGATHLGAMRFIAAAAPVGTAGTAQALHSSFAAGIVMGGAILASGTLYERFHGSAFLAMAALGVVSLLATALIWRWWDGQRL